MKYCALPKLHTIPEEIRDAESQRRTALWKGLAKEIDLQMPKPELPCLDSHKEKLCAYLLTHALESDDSEKLHEWIRSDFQFPVPVFVDAELSRLVGNFVSTIQRIVSLFQQKLPKNSLVHSVDSSLATELKQLFAPSVIDLKDLSMKEGHAKVQPFIQQAIDDREPSSPMISTAKCSKWSAEIAVYQKNNPKRSVAQFAMDCIKKMPPRRKGALKSEHGSLVDAATSLANAIRWSKKPHTVKKGNASSINP